MGTLNIGDKCLVLETDIPKNDANLSYAGVPAGDRYVAAADCASPEAGARTWSKGPGFSAEGYPAAPGKFTLKSSDGYCLASDGGNELFADKDCDWNRPNYRGGAARWIVDWVHPPDSAETTVARGNNATQCIAARDGSTRLFPKECASLPAAESKVRYVAASTTTPTSSEPSGSGGGGGDGGGGSTSPSPAEDNWWTRMSTGAKAGMISAIVCAVLVLCGGLFLGVMMMQQNKK